MKREAKARPIKTQSAASRTSGAVGRDGFCSAFATDGTWKELAHSCIQQLAPISENANLAFLYVTDAVAGNLGDILKYLRDKTGIQNWTGSVGLGICTTEKSVFERPAIAVMVATVPEGSFHIFDPIVSASQNFDAKAADWIARKNPTLGIIHCDPRRVDLSQTIAAASAVSSTFFVGAASSARQLPLQIANTVVQGGLSGVLLTPEVTTTIGISQGCTPLGPARQITKAIGNLVLEIDGRPALDVFKSDIGELHSRDIHRAAKQIFVGFPLDANDEGEYIVRYIVDVDVEQKSLLVSQTIAAGNAILFCRRDTQSATADLERMLKTLKLKSGGKPRGGLYFNCIARGPSMFGPDFEEVEMIRDILGEFPLVGFCGNGEISQNRLYYYTGVLMLFT